MKLDIQSIHFDADQKLLDFIQKKSEKLLTYFDRIINGEVFLKLDKSEQKENKVVEIKLHIPGGNVFVKETRRTFEEAVDVAIEALKVQLKKHKEKHLAHV